MIKPTSNFLNTISLIITIITFLLTYLLSINNNKIKLNVSFNSKEYYLNDEKIEKISDLIEEEKNDKKNNWTIKIPEINLIANINEGTSKEIMDKYVGHFEETSTEYGNIGLAAHNRGYPVNYFQDLKSLNIGSEIQYEHEGFEMTYEVETIEIIENTNWNYLEKTQDNRITLITCVENEPKYRRCIQGIEKIESEDF